jgi:hypothetical protein
VEVLIEGHPFRLIADSGSEVIAIYRAALPAGFPLTPESTASAAHLAGVLELTRYSSRRVLVGGRFIGSPPIFVIPGERRIEGYDGVVGTRWLTDGQVRLDFKTGTLSWSPASWTPRR